MDNEGNILMNTNELVNIGDILHSSWGYSMTLNNFYRVTKRIGKTTIEMEEIPSKWVEGDGFTGKVVPDLEAKSIRVIRKRVKESSFKGFSVKVTESQYIFGKWNGNPIYENHMD